VAPTVRSFSAEFEPLRLIARFPDRYPGLLESSTHAGNRSAAGRFDILPIATRECLRLGTDGKVEGPHAQAGGFLRSLAEWSHTLRTPSSATPLPFTGGWLLYLGYELAAEIEPRLRLPSSPDGVVALAIRAPAAWIRDRSTGQAWLVAEPGYEGLLDGLRGACARAGGPLAGDGGGLGDCRSTRRTLSGFCRRCRARSSTLRPGTFIRPTCRGSGA
jgi:anthranilate synthase component 1